ncbi:hypothetical protein BTO16_08965 [Polaribacter glomeratus]|uniref:Uncharacterized protein n=1 Tax=Polaribacter glomeratus TaxID=102 RepID=A0A2S7WYM8_9FLAO|nr:hypothetical protein BTO16_08965 [Polaribacter glomeratus]
MRYCQKRYCGIAEGIASGLFGIAKEVFGIAPIAKGIACCIFGIACIDNSIASRVFSAFGIAKKGIAYLNLTITTPMFTLIFIHRNLQSISAIPSFELYNRK